MDTTQRDLGRVQATQEIMQKDLEKIKVDLAEIKESIVGTKAVKETDWKRLSLFGIVITIINQALS